MAVQPVPIKRRMHRPYPAVSCPRCGVRLRMENLHSGQIVCGGCRKDFRAEIFELPDDFAAALPLSHGIDGSSEAPCAVHSGNAAANTCARCGNFMCGLCETELGGKIYCTTCFERVLEEGNEQLVKRRSWNFQSFASFSAIFMFVGPAAIVFAIMAIKQARREKLRNGVIAQSVVMLVIGILESLWILFAVGAVAEAMWRLHK